MSISNISTTKMSSKGQVVIPEKIREYLELETGSKFIVMATEDSVILKKIRPIPKDDLKELLAESRKIAKKYNFKQHDLNETIQEVRGQKKKKKAAIKKTKA